MGGCSIIGCKSRTEKAKNDVTFHSFPTDNNIKIVWINATGRRNWQPNRSSKICSIHFDGDAISIVNKIRRINPEAIPVKNVHTPVVSSKQTKTMTVNPTISLASTTLEYKKDQNQPGTSEFATTPRSRRKQTLLSPKNTRKRLPMNVATTPRKEKLLNLKLQKAKQISSKRLRKLRALREANRRLKKKNAHLQTTLIELQCKMNVNSEDLDMLGVDDTNTDFLFINCG